VEDVIAQIGYGNYHPKSLRFINYCSPREFINIVVESRVVITHAGIGTIGQALKFAKPVIVVPRKAELGECSDNHQWTTAKQLEKEGKILVAYEISELSQKLKEVKNLVLIPTNSGEKVIQTVEAFLKKLEAKEHRGSNE
jgi:UDP-N-acetylglucosamine transferase subunit ALG13